MSSGRPPIVSNSPACQRILRVLRRGPQTPEQISLQAHVGVNTLTKGAYLRTLEAAGLVHVSAWLPPPRSGMWTPVWSLGAGPSVPMPPRQSAAEYSARWRRKNGLSAGTPRRRASTEPASGPWGWLAL